MKHWRIALEIQIARHGLWFVPGLLALALAAWFWLFWLSAREAALQSVLDEVALAARRPSVAADEAPIGLPENREVDPYLQTQKVFELASSHGLQIAQAEYRRVEAGRIGRLQMQLPARASYPQIRQFLRALRAAQPEISLDELNVRRNEGGVEARLLFSVWYVVPRKGGQ